MNLLYLNDDATVTGGAAAVAIAEACAMADKGYRTAFLSGTPHIDPRLITAGVEVISSGQLAPIDRGQRDATPSVFRRASTALHNHDIAKILDDWLSNCASGNKPDIAHIHGWSKLLTGAVLPVLKRHGLKIILTMHDYFIHCPNGGFYDFNKHEICYREPMSLPCIACNCDSRNYAYKLFRLARQHQFKRSGMPTYLDLVIAINRYSLRPLQSFIEVANIPVTVIHNPLLQLPNAAPHELAQKPSANIIGFTAGRWSKEKGFDLFLDAMAKTKTRGILAGVGPLEDEFRQKAAQNRDSITLMPWLDAKAMQQQYQHADFFVLPSRWMEPEGLVWIEAAAMGLPLVVSSTTAAAEFVQRHDAGLVWQSGNDLALADAISAFKQMTPDRRRSMGQNAYNGILTEQRDLPSHIEALLDLYMLISA